MTAEPETAPAAAAFDLPALIAEQATSGAAWTEFFRVPDLSLGLYVLPAGGTDGQAPHPQDEIYYVVSGRAQLNVAGEEHPAHPGAILYVAANTEHRFHGIEETLTLLVFFAPAYTGRA